MARGALGVPGGRHQRRCQIAVIATILRAPQDPNAPPLGFIVLFAALCAIVLATRIVSQMLISHLTQMPVLEMQMGLRRRVLDSPVRRLEEIGSPRLLATVTGDVAMISQAMSGVPTLGVNFVILACGAVYLGSFSFRLLPALLGFAVSAIVSYVAFATFAERQYLEDRPIYVFDEWAADQDPAFRRVFYLLLLPELKRRGKTCDRDHPRRPLFRLRRSHLEARRREWRRVVARRRDGGSPAHGALMPYRSEYST